MSRKCFVCLVPSSRSKSVVVSVSNSELTLGRENADIELIGGRARSVDWLLLLYVWYTAAKLTRWNA